MTFSNVSALKTLSAVPQPNEISTLLGYYAPDDKGGGEFYWDATSTETDNQGTIFQVTVGGTLVATGRWKRIYTSSLNIRWFGAKGDGITPDETAFTKCIQTAGSGSEILLGRGNYRLTAGLSFIGYSNVRFVGNRCTLTADFTGGALFTFTLNQPTQQRAEGIEFVEVNFQATDVNSGTTCLSFSGYPKVANPAGPADYNYYAAIRIIQCNIANFDTAIKFNICRNILVDNCWISGNKNGIYFLDKHAESMVRDTVIYCAGSANAGTYGIKSESSYSGDYNTNEGLVIEGCTLDQAQYGIYARNAIFWKIIGNYIGTQLPFDNALYNTGYRAYSILLERDNALATPANSRTNTITSNNIFQGAIKISNLTTGIWSLLTEIADNVFTGMNDNAIQIGPRMAHLNITDAYVEKISPTSINGAVVELDSDSTVINISKLTSNQSVVNAVNIKGANVTFTNIEGIVHAGSGAIINNPSNNSITVSNLRGNGLSVQKAFANVAVNTYSSSTPLSVSTASIPVYNGMKGRITLVGAFNPSVAGQVLQLATTGVSVTIPNGPGSSAQFHTLYGTGMRMVCHVIPFTANATGNLSVGIAVLNYFGGTTAVDYHTFLTIETDAY
ncbi:glycosyl hydrolase family 28-related protein [Chitinophaga filiformis]|uniref:Rhamnogalacturonase A/B/Epimerase-like pectate lyase domain-containing protein n=1 Tax=Chitinophaga filiformis TaxID=104663 RepID=A0A1G7RL83_CHIFI|nr:glycosyl hydrolase family 28-related protein [Chitinophaga filiformis]SDG11425.1 hypothetical protein SAMN04488121_103511 [Chitinophaga filiformis]